ncbi:hypothetical protein CHUAL_012164 [Chamberlinius hualienensis]
MNFIAFIVLICIVVVSGGRKRDEDSDERHVGDSGERTIRLPYQPPRRSGSDASSSEEDSSDEDSSYPPKIWLDTLHEGQGNIILELAYLDSNLAVYFDQKVNRSAKWPFEIISKAWQYVKLQYGPISHQEEPWLWIKVHSDKVKSQKIPSSLFNGRNVIDISTTADEAKEESIVQIARLIESSYKSLNFSCLLDNVAKPWPLITYDIYRNVSKHCADNFLQKLRSFLDGSDPKCSRIGFKRFYYPLYSQKNCSKLLIKFFNLVAENSKHFDQKPLSREEFVHFWSSIAKIDLKLLFESAFQVKLDQIELENTKKKYSNLSYCSQDD